MAAFFFYDNGASSSLSSGTGRRSGLAGVKQRARNEAGRLIQMEVWQQCFVSV
jgi:hypothetical protein